MPPIPYESEMRFGCDHEWKPVGMIDWECSVCGKQTEGFPKDGPSRWTRFRRWLARARA
jgi:hypothetical protein